jgi:hypothetical protein
LPKLLYRQNLTLISILGVVDFEKGRVMYGFRSNLNITHAKKAQLITRRAFFVYIQMQAGLNCILMIIGELKNIFKWF